MNIYDLISDIRESLCDDCYEHINKKLDELVLMVERLERINRLFYFNKTKKIKNPAKRNTIKRIKQPSGVEN